MKVKGFDRSLKASDSSAVEMIKADVKSDL
jgi:hypothetical protein